MEKYSNHLGDFFLNIPPEIQQHIAAYLDAPSLGFFAITSKCYLTDLLPLLLAQQKTSLTYPNLGLIAGGNNSYLYQDQKIFACGYNVTGECNKAGYKIFTQIETPPGKILQVVAASTHIFILTEKGLWSCGDNSCGRLGRGGNCYTLTKIDHIPSKILQVIIGDNHTFVLTDKALWACGSNTSGQLALKQAKNVFNFTEVKNIPGKILQVVAGVAYTVILTNQGLWACGNNNRGQLGLCGKQAFNTLTKVENAPSNISKVITGYWHTIVLTDQGLWSCGANPYGQLGLGHTDDCNTLTKMSNVQGEVLQVVAGSSHTVVLTTEGLWTCGKNIDGQLGLGDYQNRYTLTKIENISAEEVLQVIVGTDHTLILTTKGLLACGNNQYGQLGLWHKENCNTLIQVKKFPEAIKKIFLFCDFTNLLKTFEESKINHSVLNIKKFINYQSDEAEGQPPLKKMRL